MEKTTLYLPSDLQRELQETARRTRRTQADLVREALREYLRGQSHPLPRSVGKGSDREVTGRKSEEWLDREWDPR